MSESNEEIFNRGLAITELVKTVGWSILEKWIKEEIQFEQEELEKIPIENIGVQRIGTEYLRHKIAIDTYKKILSRVEDLLQQKESAADRMR